MLSTFPSLQLRMDLTTKSLLRPTRSTIAWVWTQRNSRGGPPFTLHWQTHWRPQWSRSFLPRIHQRTKLLREKLAIIQEAQVWAVSVGFAAASNLQLLRRDALLKNFGTGRGTGDGGQGTRPIRGRGGDTDGTGRKKVFLELLSHS